MINKIPLRNIKDIKTQKLKINNFIKTQTPRINNENKLKRFENFTNFQTFRVNKENKIDKQKLNNENKVEIRIDTVKTPRIKYINNLQTPRLNAELEFKIQ